MTSENPGYNLDAIDCLRRHVAPETMQFLIQAANEASQEGDRGVQVASDVDTDENYQLAIIENSEVVFECGDSGPQRVPIDEFKILFGIVQN